jgi:hypothetical protein
MVISVPNSLVLAVSSLSEQEETNKIPNKLSRIVELNIYCMMNQFFDEKCIILNTL